MRIGWWWTRAILTHGFEHLGSSSLSLESSDFKWTRASLTHSATMGVSGVPRWTHAAELTSTIITPCDSISSVRTIAFAGHGVEHGLRRGVRLENWVSRASSCLFSRFSSQRRDCPVRLPTVRAMHHPEQSSLQIAERFPNSSGDAVWVKSPLHRRSGVCPARRSRGLSGSTPRATGLRRA